MKTVRSLSVALILVAVAACGVRPENLSPPAGTDPTWPRAYEKGAEDDGARAPR